MTITRLPIKQGLQASLLSSLLQFSLSNLSSNIFNLCFSLKVRETTFCSNFLLISNIIIICNPLIVPGKLRVMGSGWMTCISFNLLLQHLLWSGFFEFPLFHSHIRHLNVFEIKALIKSLVTLYQIIFRSLATVNRTLLKPLITLPDNI